VGDAIESAIVSLSMQGADAVQRQADKVTVDLSSAKRAGEQRREHPSRSAEKAARSAESASNDLQSSASSAISKLSMAGRISGHLLGAGALSELGSGARLGGEVFSLLTSLLPGGGLTTLLAGGLALGAGAYYAHERSDKDEDRDEASAERIAKHLSLRSDSDLEAQMLQKMGISKVDRAVGGGF
jgi:hypothetical protein